ncbi:MAG: cupin-like domain-containing protein, partial [Gammaproteobacteria bacterium]
FKTNGLDKLKWRTNEWTPDYLKSKAGNQVVNVLSRKSGETFGPENAAYVPMRFAEFIDQVMVPEDGNDDLYLNLQNLGAGRVIEPPITQLLGDFTLPDIYRDLQIRSVNLWMGNNRSRTTTHLHHDFNDNLYAVVEGCKHFVVFPPEQAANLYPRGEVLHVQKNGIIRYKDMHSETMPHFSQLNLNDVDRVKFPGYQEAERTRYEFLVEKDEILFLPCGWFHQVSSDGKHIALSFFAEVPSTAQMKTLEQSLTAVPPQ